MHDGYMKILLHQCHHRKLSTENTIYLAFNSIFIHQQLIKEIQNLSFIFYIQHTECILHILIQQNNDAMDNHFK